MCEETGVWDGLLGEGGHDGHAGFWLLGHRRHGRSLRQGWGLRARDLGVGESAGRVLNRDAVN